MVVEAVGCSSTSGACAGSQTRRMRTSLRDRRTQRDAMFRAQNCNQDAGETVDGRGAFPRFPTDDAADEATRRIHASK